MIIKIRADEIKPGDFIEMDGLLRVEEVLAGEDDTVILVFSGLNDLEAPRDQIFTVDRPDHPERTKGHGSQGANR